MARKIKQGFHMELVELPLADLFPTKTVSPQIKQGRKYRQVLSSVREVGLIEPPVVTPLKNGKGYWLKFNSDTAYNILGINVTPKNIFLPINAMHCCRTGIIIYG